MNIYLLSLIGLVALLAAGALVYGVINKSANDEQPVPLTPVRFVIAGVAMYVISYLFIMLFQHVDLFGSGIAKGLALGLVVGIGFFALPLFADAPYLRGKENLTWVVLGNWVLAFLLLGLVTGIWG